MYPLNPGLSAPRDPVSRAWCSSYCSKTPYGLNTYQKATLTPKPVCRVMVTEPDSHKSDSSKPEHVIFKITINEDEDYALDVTGSQFGFYDTLTPWASYQHDRIEILGRILPLSRLRDSQRLPSKKSSQKNRNGATTKALNDHFAETFGSVLKSWEAKKGTFTAMLKLREASFRKAQGELLDFIDKHASSREKQPQEAKDPKKKPLQAS